MKSLKDIFLIEENQDGSNFLMWAKRGGRVEFITNNNQESINKIKEDPKKQDYVVVGTIKTSSLEAANAILDAAKKVDPKVLKSLGAYDYYIRNMN